MSASSIRRITVLAGICLAGLMYPRGDANAATNDVTGLTPTMHVTFNAASVVNDNGAGSITVNAEGTASFPASPNGAAINTASFTPYGNLTSVFSGGSAFTVSAYATLGSTVNGLMFHLRDDVGGSTGGLVLRRGTTNEVVLTLNAVSTPILSVGNIPGGDIVYHHYAVVATAGGITLYVDGAARATTTSNAVATAKYAYQFGSRHGGVRTGETKTGGKIDDFRVYTGALSLNQIQSLWLSMVTPGVDAGSISIRTGVRDNSPGGGNIWLYPSSSLGPVPSAALAWNKTPNNTGSMIGVLSNLMNSAESLTYAKLYYTCPNTYLGAGGTATANECLTKTYLDDGTAGSYTVNEGGLTNVALPNPGVTRGWQVMLTGVPYQYADLYVVIASDQAQASFKACPLLVKVGDGNWTSYYGVPGLEKTVVGNQTWPGSVYSSGTLKEGSHYVKISLNDITTNTAISIAHGPRNTGIAQRIGLAGLQIVKRASAAPTADPYYQRAVAGSANWSAAVWENAGVPNNSWSNSAPEWKTTAVLTTSGTASLELPDEGVIAEGVSVRGSGPFTLAGQGALALNGAAVIDAYGMQSTDVVTIATCVSVSNATLAANNANASGVGYTRLSNPTNAFSALTVTRGTLAANSMLPPASSLTLGGGSLMFTASGSITNPLSVTADGKLRVWASQTGEVAVPIAGAGSAITKSDAGSLILSGGGTFKSLTWDNAGLVRLTGATPYSLTDLAGYVSHAASLDLPATVTMSGGFFLGGATATLGPSSVITANQVRWCDGGAFNTTVNQSGGRLTALGGVNNVSTGDSVLFAHWAGVCNYNLSGGEFLATNAVAMLAWNGAATWAISGGARAYVKGVNMRGSTGGAATLSLNNGTLEVGGSGIFASSASGTRAINLYTGTVRAWSDFSVAANAVTAAVALKDSAAGVTLDSNGRTVTVNAPLADVGKLVVNDSAVTKGRVKLSGASSHVGGIDLLAGTLELGATNALGTGAVLLSGGTLDLAAVDAAAGSVTVANPVTLKVRVSAAADLSGSGSLAPSSLALNCDATNAVSVVLDLNGTDAPLAEYPIVLTSAFPSDATNKMTVAFVNGGAGLLPTAAVALQSRAGGIYAVFSGVLPPKNLFWRNGVAAGDWSADLADTPWGEGSISGAASAYTTYDTVNFTDTDQPSVTVNVQGGIKPIALNVNNAITAYTFTEDVGGGSIELLGSGFTKTSAGDLTFNVPIALTNTLSVQAGALAFGSTLGTGTVATSTFSYPLTVATNATCTFAPSEVQTLSGTLSGQGAVRSAAGRVRIAGAAGSWTSLAGDLVAGSGSVLEIASPLVGQNGLARLRVEAGAVMELTALDASGYAVTNGNPIEIAGTLKLLERDSTARGVRMYDGAAILLKGTNMNSGHAMDLFDRPTFALVSGAASIRPLDTNVAAEASITVRTEHSPKTFDVQASNAVLSVDVPLIGGAPGIVLDKVGPGTLKLTGASTTASKLKVTAGTIEICGAGSLGAGSSAQPVEVLADATFRLASTADQTLSGAITNAGLLAKSGSGKLVVSGVLSVTAGGVLEVPATTTTNDAVRVDALTMGGVLRVSNIATLTSGRTFYVLTAASALPSGLEAQVAGLPEHWRAEVVDGGKTLVVYKPLGSLMLVQ